MNIKYEAMNKQKLATLYLLGTDEDGIKYWLKAPSWDCDWYWGFGYIETKDSHQHANNFMDWCKEWNGKEPILKKTTFTDNEAWQLCELFKRFYMFKDMAEYYHIGGAHITTIKDEVSKKDEEKEKHINEVEIPYITAKILDILKPKQRKRLNSTQNCRLRNNC